MYSKSEEISLSVAGFVMSNCWKFRKRLLTSSFFTFKVKHEQMTHDFEKEDILWYSTNSKRKIIRKSEKFKATKRMFASCFCFFFTFCGLLVSVKSLNCNDYSDICYNRQITHPNDPIIVTDDLWCYLQTKHGILLLFVS